jgi:hypothetical protein
MKNYSSKFYIAIIIAILFVFTNAATSYAETVKKASTSSVDKPLKLNKSSTDVTTNGNIQIVAKEVKKTKALLTNAAGLNQNLDTVSISTYFGGRNYIYGKVIAKTKLASTDVYYQDGVRQVLYIYDSFDNYYKVYITDGELPVIVEETYVAISGYIVGKEDVTFDDGVGIVNNITHVSLVTNPESVEVTNISDDAYKIKFKSTPKDDLRFIFESVNSLSNEISAYDPSNNSSSTFDQNNFNTAYLTVTNQISKFKKKYSDWDNIKLSTLYQAAIYTFNVEDLNKALFDIKTQLEIYVFNYIKTQSGDSGENYTIISVEANIKDNWIPWLQAVIDTRSKYDSEKQFADASLGYLHAILVDYTTIIKETKTDDRYTYEVSALKGKISQIFQTVKDMLPHYYTYQPKLSAVAYDNGPNFSLAVFEEMFNEMNTTAKG